MSDLPGKSEKAPRSSIKGSAIEKGNRKLRLGMVGGGRGAFIGSIHRMAARLDDRFQLVAGALSSDKDNAKASALDLNIDSERAYLSYSEMLVAERRRPDRIGIRAVRQAPFGLVR
jgi:predicted dehydrogenase